MFYLNGKIQRVLLKSGIVLLLLSLIGYLISQGYSQSWTGFQGYSDSTGKNIPAKKLWDWMTLLIVPLSLSLIAYLFSRQERKIDREIAAEQYQQRLLQDYLDRISKLLLDKADELQPENRVATVAQVLTLTALRQSDVIRRTAILRFLSEARLIQIGKRIIDLNRAELSEIVLPGVNLEEADLSGAILKNCDLRKAILRKANLNGAILNGSNLSHADLKEAELGSGKLIRCNLDHALLSNANLSSAELRDCNLKEALLCDSILEGADLTGSDLSKAHLQGAYFAAAKFERVILKGILWSDQTRWPMDNFQLPTDAFNISKYWRDQASQTEDSFGEKSQ
jgi:uncharacterized protein YjbI with pentapeptide repeats